MEKSLIYVWHDCFVYVGTRCAVAFDYWRDGDGFYGDTVSIDELVRAVAGRRVYVLVSHHHKDHFNRRVFGWASELPDVRYVISKDTARTVHYLLKEGSTYSGSLKVNPERVLVLREGEEYEDSLLRVSAFGSTDIGNSYVVEVDGLKLFHAGDLNAWMWKDESTEAEVQAAIRDFERKVEAIRARYPRLDYAMFPVDARIGCDWWEGAWRFVRMVDVGCFIPMHFCLFENEEERLRYMRCATTFSLYANPARGAYASMSVPGERLLL